MPYLDHKIDLNKHKKTCVNPVGKRLYIRDYDEEGKQRFVSWGLTCTSCDVVIKEKFQHNLSITQKSWEKRLKEGPFGSEEVYERNQRYKVIDKLKRIKRRELGPEPISSKENGFRKRIKGYNSLYSYEYNDKMRNLIRWNPNVVKEFLYMTPRPTIEELKKVIYSSPLGRYNNGSDIYRMSRLAPDPDKPGYVKYDTSPWIPDPNNPGKMVWNHDPDFISDHDKAIIQEAQIRRKLMEDMLKERGIVEITDSFVEYTRPKQTYKELTEELKGN